MTSRSTHGTPSWADLSTPRVDEASDFYTRLLGWEVEVTDTPMGEYRIARVGTRQVGGLMAPPPHEADMPPTWTVFFDVDDIEAAADRAAAAGGTVLQAPVDIPDGRVAVVADPTGAMLGLISGPDHDGTWLSTEPGSASWVELLTRDTAAAETFYAVLFGWKATTEASTGTSYTTFRVDADVVAGMMAMPDTVPVGAPAHWAVYFAVTDCDEATARAVDLGGQVLLSPTAVGTERFAVLADPSGATFHLLASPAPDARR